MDRPTARLLLRNQNWLASEGWKAWARRQGGTGKRRTERMRRKVHAVVTQIMIPLFKPFGNCSAVLMGDRTNHVVRSWRHPFALSSDGRLGLGSVSGCSKVLRSPCAAMRRSSSYIALPTSLCILQLPYDIPRHNDLLEKRSNAVRLLILYCDCVLLSKTHIVF